jgi:hypothetical protein
MGIQNCVGELLEDLIDLLGLGGELDARKEISWTKIKCLPYEDFKRSDFWIVKARTGRPILIVAVKSPGVPNVLDNPKVHGQALDCMADIMSSFGQYHVFGITTTMEEFRVHWFPHSDQYAAATAIPAIVDTPELDRAQVVRNRVLHHSRLMRHDDPDLLVTLTSVVLKSWRSPYASVGLLDLNRAFIRLTSANWNWVRMEKATIDALTLDPDLSGADPTAHVIVKCFLRADEKKVWMVITEPQGRLMVAKVVQDAVKAAREVEIWNRANECTTAFTTVICAVPAICTPFVFNASEDCMTRRVWFDLDLSRWIVQRGAVAQPLPPSLAQFQAQLKHLGVGLDPRDIARQAIDRMAQLGLQHDDLAWRHIALMPVVQEGKVTALKPALIDFGEVTDNVDPAAARAVMHAKLQEMEKNCVFGEEPSKLT